MTPLAKSPSRSWLVCWWRTLGPMAQTLLVLLAAPLLVLNVWAIAQIFEYFRAILVSVLVAALLAFLLSYPVGWLNRLGLKRGLSSLVVLLATVLVLLTITLTVLPLVIDQAQQLVSKLPEWFDSGKSQLLTLDNRFETWGIPFNLDGLIAQVNDRLKTEFEAIAGEALNLTLGVAVFTANKLLDVLLTIVLTFYLLQHSDEVWGSLVSWLPQSLQAPFSDTLRLSFRNYFLGQFIVATCLGTTLTILFLVLQVPFGLLFGFTIGLAALLPFGGTVGIVVVTLLVALRDIGIAVQVVIASVIVQQLIENGLAPRVLGSFTGLNPFWVFIAILSGARVGGLLGVIVAVFLVFG
ncbi:MAG: AI-2E family transporter [Leptolyngbya sp. SIO1D8]|nr:AI-2E family transporter [Leptolyngbya sp. SIO1D8]